MPKTGQVSTFPGVMDMAPPNSYNVTRKGGYYDESLNLKTVLRSFDSDASLVLVGVRGSGKRSLGFIAAAELRRRFVTEEHYFKQVTNLSRQQYLERHGKDEFHKKESRVSISMLEDNKSNCIIECGLASLTSSVQDYLRQYCKTHPVIYLARDMQKIRLLLKLDSRASRLLQSAEPSHRRCTNFEFFNVEEDIEDARGEAPVADRHSPTYAFKLKSSQEDFSNFARFIMGTHLTDAGTHSPFSLSRTPIEERLFTHCLWTQLSWFLRGRVPVPELEGGGDVLEINVDEWDRLTVPSLTRIVAEIRRQIATPIMVGCNLDQTRLSTSDAVDSLHQGLRLGVEFIAVDLRLSNEQITGLVASKGSTRVLGSFVSTLDHIRWSDPSWIQTYERAQSLGCDMVRLVSSPISRDDDGMLSQFRFSTRDPTRFRVPLIAFNAGSLGRTSQISNPILTSVTHSSLPRAEDSVATLTSQQAVEALFASFALDPLTIKILGANVSKSLSPHMHNAAYRLLGLRHVYSTQNIITFAEFEAFARNFNFGGASIVQPWKVELVDKVAALSNDAKAIGAINTVLPIRAEGDGGVPPLNVQARHRNRAGKIAAWFGENTDWIGIKVCMNRNLSPRNVVQPKRTTALIIGAGGMARAAIYAVLQMGCRKVFVFNRTLANAQAVADHFNTSEAVKAVLLDHSQSLVRVISSREDPWPADHAMPTMIISCVTQETIYGKQPANFTLPDSWLGSDSGGLCMEMSYVSKDTPLVEQIRKFRKETGKPWVLVDGLETLPEQAIAQLELMTGRKAPRRCIREAIVKAAAEREAQEATDAPQDLLT